MVSNTEKASSPVHALSCPIEANGKKLPKASTKTFLATTACIPVWASTVLPISVAYQVGATVLKPLLGPRQESDNSKNLDSGYIVTEKLIPRNERKYDIVVLGATGFTGYLAAMHLAKNYGINQGVNWAIAGRSQEKLNDVKCRLAKEIVFEKGNELTKEMIDSIDTIIVDTSIPSTMPNLVRDTRVVATTAGPYTLYGNSVVEFCAKFATHYVDITGEVDWVKAMICQWQDTAQKNRAKIISFCGHDSIPWDVSVMKMKQALKTEFDDDLVSVTFWDKMKGAAPGGTYATIINAIEGNSIKAPRINFDPFLRLPDGSKSEYKCKAELPSLLQQENLPWDKASNRQWTMPFVMAVVNAQVVRWTHALQKEGSISLTYKEVAAYPDFKTAFVNYAGLIMFGSMLFNPVTSTLAKKYIVPKSGEGPSMHDMENKHFLCVHGEGIGRKGNRVETTFYLNKDAGCLETSRMLVESGLCLALQEKELPSPETGGLMSPVAGLGNTLMNRLLNSGGVTFEYRVVPTSTETLHQSKL